MRKLFRMKHEPCDGACYAHEDVLKTHEMGLSLDETRTLLAGITKIHDISCGNDQIAYGLDFDEDRVVFVASFIHYGKLELFLADSAYVALTDLVWAVAHWIDLDPSELRERPGIGKDVCAHGDDQDLRAFALKFSGLPIPTQRELSEHH